MDDLQSSSRKKIIIVITGIIILILVLGLGYYFLLRKDATGTTKPLGALFGNVAENVSGTSDTNTGITQTSNNNTDINGTEKEPLFRQLSTIPTSGATSVTLNGKTFVRYVTRELGYVYQVDPKTGDTTQLTNTTIPRIYEAYWGEQGNSVVLRFLKDDQVTKQGIIKTYLAYLNLPLATGSSTDAIGSLTGEFLPDNISAVSMSPDGKKLFYLLPIPEGVSGSIVDLSTKNTREVFRNSFSEWLPELQNNDQVILTTKPSANIKGFSYLYDFNKKSFTRLLREKDGLTTHGQSGDKMLYSENIGRNNILGLYDAKGFSTDEGAVSHEEPLSLTTLPEKCAWFNNTKEVLCGSFTANSHMQIPDDWYRSVYSFSDTFWKINTDTSEITLIADPKDTIKQEFDVLLPFITRDQTHFIFVNKKDGTLWSMHIEETVAETTENTQGLTPEELKDAQGSAPSPTTDTGN